MKETEERELNGEVALNAHDSPVKPSEEVNGEEGAGKSGATAEEQEQDQVPPPSVTDGGPDEKGTTNNSLPGTEPHSFDTAQGALGQVKAKVEVCKDESIGKDFSYTYTVIVRDRHSDFLKVVISCLSLCDLPS